MDFKIDEQSKHVAQWKMTLTSYFEPISA